MKTVADLVGVSPMTVSNAFSRPDQLSSAVRQRVLAAAAELGYAGPDPSARSLARGATGTVGILRTESPQYAFHDEHSAILLAAIAEELGQAGLALTLLPTSGAGNVVPARDVAMDGAIVYSCRPAADGVGWLRMRGLPLVYVDQAGESGASSVNLDDRGGAQAAARHLIELGHQRIALVSLGRGAEGDSTDWYVARQRMAGWQDVLAEAGIEPLVLRSPSSTQEDGADTVRKLLGDPDRPTGMLCFSDAVAAGVLRAAEDAGVRVPEDLSVIGFDDTPLARRLRPQLTSVHQDISGKGRAAAAALVGAIARRRGGPGEAQHVMLPTNLVVRASTAAPPNGSTAR